MTFDFAGMISPIEANTFFDEYWEKRPLVLSGRAPDRYAGLFSLADLDHILSSTDLRYPALRLIRNGPDLPTEAYTYDLRSRRFVFTGACDAERVLWEYQRGATILLQRVERSWAPLAELCRNLEALLHHPVDANAYLTPRSAQGFAAHYDTHDVFILQIAGAKHWRLYDAPLRLPMESQPHSATQLPFGACTHECDLQPGDLIYLPRGTGHEALTSDSSSLHITLGVTPHTWADVLVDAVLTAAHQDERFRESVPLALRHTGDEAFSFAEHFSSLLATLSESVRVDAVLDRLSERFIAARPPLLNGQLAQIDELHHLGLETMVVRRPGVIYRLISTDDGVTLAFHRRKITYPLHMEPTLRYIAAAPPFQVGSIPHLEPLERMLLVQRLVREGFLTLTP
jgi:ribosomal protein L16 Arg81 hydroxylase